MAHVQLYVIAPPDRHKDIQKAMNEWRYKVEGTHYTGHTRPFVCVGHHYDIRIKKELVSQFLTDFEVIAWDKKDRHLKNAKEGKNNWSGFGLHWASRIIRIFWKINPFVKGPKFPLPDKNIYKMKDWHYAFLIGVNQDIPKKTSINDKEREVL